MTKVRVKLFPNHKMDGEGESLGEDLQGQSHTYWGSMPDIEIPIELAIKLENEKPQRFKIKDNKVRDYLNLDLEKEPEPIVEEQDVSFGITKKQLNDMTKDDINDWAARKGFDVNTRNRKKTMIDSLIEQIERSTGKKVE